MGTIKQFYKLLLESCLSCCETCDRYSEGRAGYVVKTDLVAELYGCGVTTVLTADTYVELLVCGTAKSYSHIHKLISHRFEKNDRNGERGEYFHG